jgi:hypothetical protein
MASFVALCGETPSVGSALLRCERVFGVHDAVAISLLGQEPLAVSREVSVDCVAGDHGVEPRATRARRSGTPHRAAHGAAPWFAR